MSLDDNPVESLISNDRMSRSLFALLELSKALSSEVDLDALLHVIVENASAVVEADRTSIFIYDAARDRLFNRLAQGLETFTIELPLGSGVAGDVALTRTLANIRNVYEDPRFDASIDKRSGYQTTSMICAPVLDATGRLLGVIQSVNKTTGNYFDERDESLMRAIASHVAVAFERTRLTEVHLRNEGMEQALRLASEIQMRMLPDGSAVSPEGSFRVAAHLRPAKSVGGDLYDYFWDDHRLCFCIGDVSGKGVGAALIMAVTKTLFRANAALRDDPATVLGAMSARLYEETDPSMFVTALCGSLDLQSGTLRYSIAGHDAPILLPVDSAEISTLEGCPGLPLGVFPEFTYTTSETTLRAGDALFLFTDGVSEATRGENELWGFDRLRRTLVSSVRRDPDAVLQSVLNALDEFVEGGPQADDITMMCVRYDGPPRQKARYEQ